MPVFQQLEPNLQWIRAVVTRDNPYNFSFAITINGYGNFPAEWLGLEVAGRTHRARRAAPQDACVYATCFENHPIDDALSRAWHGPANQPVLVGHRPGDTPQVWVFREGTVTLFHELLHHAIAGFRGHASPYDEWVEQRARQNWNGNR